MKARRVWNPWINICDMMSGLLYVFMFIAVAFMLQVHTDKKSMADIALNYERSKKALHEELQNEFGNDLDKWGAQLLDDNTIRFVDPDLLFAPKSSDLELSFRSLLEDFFPRYIKILTRSNFKDEIDEVRIEGHTSSTWESSMSEEGIYINNARLSQDRSFNVLKFVYTLPGVENYRPWLRGVLRANGLSYARRIYDENNNEDFVRSRRVEFRVSTKTEERIYTIIDKSRPQQHS